MYVLLCSHYCYATIADKIRWRNTLVSKGRHCTLGLYANASKQKHYKTLLVDVASYSDA